MSELNQIQAMIIDLDGVLWLGDTPLPGVVDLFNLLHRKPIQYILATNNATADPNSVCNRLDMLGVIVEPNRILTSSQASARFLQQQLPQGSLVYTIGELPLRTALTQAGFILTDAADGAQAVVVGLDRQLSWNTITEATLAIQAGAMFIGTNPDVSFPMERGQAPGVGAILAALKAATGVQPTIVGKPEPHLFLQALHRLDTEPKRTLAIGDRLETDILGGQNSGMLTCLVLTGVTKRQDLLDSPIQPDYVFEDLPQLCRVLVGEEP
ncbi:MAG: HAD-IIA family hydrolase [Anaerolineales bacterium]